MKVVAHLLILILGAQLLSALTLEELQVSYKLATLKVNAEREDEVDTLNKQYLRALDRYQIAYQKKSDLDRALLVKQEADLIKAKTWPLPELPEEIVSKVKNARATYLKSRLDIRREWATSYSQISEKMIAALEEQVGALTKAGKLEEAKEAKAAAESLAKNPDVILARELPDRLTPGGNSRAAYIVRRPGDNLEVLVRYDTAGKVSMKSPVENIVEKTGGNRDKGKTAAKTLGEFVGAKGFDVEPHVAFHETQESGKLKFDENAGLTPRSKLTENDKSGVGFEIEPNIANAYLTMNGVMSPTNAPVTHRITGEYFVPSTNKFLGGVFLRHGDSKTYHIYTPHLLTKGKWTTFSLEGPSGSPEDFLRVHLAIPSFDDYPKAAGEVFLLRELKIEYIRYSAFIVEAYGKSGEAQEKTVEAVAQKPLVLNGVLVSDKN